MNTYEISQWSIVIINSVYVCIVKYSVVFYFHEILLVFTMYVFTLKQNLTLN